MLANERQSRIYDLIRQNGSVETTKLAELFGVSIETVRKDLVALEKQSAILKIHGGAVAKSQFKQKQKLLIRCEENNDRKKELALKAMEFICEGDIIGVDEGSTAIIFAKALKERFSRLTVVTYSLDVLNILRECDGFELVLCGGTYMKEERSFYGKQTLDALGNMHVQKAFIFPTAISLEFGICGYNDNILQVQDGLIKSANEVYMLADSDKFEKTALQKLRDNDEKFNYITDNMINKEIRKKFKDNNLKLFIKEKE